MSHKIAILHQGFIPLYRVAFYQRLNQLGPDRYVVFHGKPPAHSGHYELPLAIDFPNVWVRNMTLSMAGYDVIYQSVLRAILSGSYDAVVVGHELKFLSNMFLFLLFKMMRKPVLFWGHGFNKQQERVLDGGRVAATIGKLKGALARWADHYLVYSEGGAQSVMQLGMPSDKITVIRNTLDMEEQRVLYETFQSADPIELRRHTPLRSDSLVLLYVGRMYKEKHLEEALEVVRRVNGEHLCPTPIELVMIGDGPELERLRTLGTDLQAVHFLGEIYDQAVIAQYMRLASAMIIPGKVGLVANHALSHGLPVMTRAHARHAPEVEYIESGYNGLIVEGDFDAFLHAVVGYLKSPERQLAMSEAALATRQTLTLEFMAAGFQRAVQQALGVAEPKRAVVREPDNRWAMGG